MNHCRRDYTGVSPLRQNRILYSYIKGKAEILNQLFQTVSTGNHSHIDTSLYMYTALPAMPYT